ncbi:MAG: gspG [Ramlibacter sp.]|jgi:general secretion pathway protein G|nr:gspG [Ramlibacter sp.]MDB5912853.1 gspG [Ramlibacter sp.]
MKACARTRGFTLIELLATVAIVALLASAAVQLAQVSARRTKEQELRLNLRELRTALDAYKRAVEEGRISNVLQDSGYPPSLQVLVDGLVDAGSPDHKRRIYFLRRLPRDPFAPDPAVAPEDTWGKRSYASPPDAPQEGEDVFDVFSKAPGVGLNGVPYARW